MLLHGSQSFRKKVDSLYLTTPKFLCKENKIRKVHPCIFYLLLKVKIRVEFGLDFGQN